MGATKEEARNEILKLIDKYKKVVNMGKLKSYNEEMTKKDFILPLFRALGWSVEDGEEVTAEEKISRGRVDYAFRIEGIPKLFLEAKALKVDLNKKEFAEQAINYAWHKGATWAILTDFEGIKVFNAEWKSANYLQNQFFGLTYNQFLDRFEQLWLLSRESLEKGLIDKEAEKWGKKAKKIPVDKQLLNDLTRFRELLNKNILKNNSSKNLSGDELDEAVQRIIDRLIFIRTLEDKQLEAPCLQSLIRETKSKKFYKKLNNLFREIDDIYNSKLFMPHLCEELIIDDDALEKIIYGLFKTLDNTVHYDFSAIDADVLGNIYEQYLGHILKKTAKRAKLADGKTHRKEQGIYYTPTYVVDYIVKNTVGELAKNKKFDLRNIKVLDPACGSGSFLMKAFDYLVTLDKQKNGDVDQTKLDLTGASATYGRKVEILKNNIFGVDLDPKAVEIAQLNLLLKAAEKKHRLPTLQENIKVGNSLIEDSNIAGDKAFSWEKEFNKIMDKRGFDVVIGNPPYINAIQLTKTLGQNVKNYWKNKYFSAKGTYDIYVLFFEQALNVCKEGGFVSFITPNKYLSSPYGKALRELICKNYKLVKVLDLSKIRVFEDPSVYPIITIIQKTKPNKGYHIITERIFSENVSDKKSYKISSENLSLLPDYIWGIILSNNVKIIEKVFKASKPLEEVAIVQATSTAAEADEFSRYIRENHKGLPIINTGTIDRYSTTYGLIRFMNKGHKLLSPVLDITKINENRRKLYKSPKIIIAKLALRIEGFLDGNGSYSSINTNCIHTPKEGFSIEYLTALINSKFMSFIYSELFSGLRMSGGYFQFQAPQLRIMPIVKASKHQQEKVSSLVKKVMSLNEKRNKIGDKTTDEKDRLRKEIERLDDEIDKEIYKIYGLTKEEIKIIEGSLK
jgi:type I restriction-modification system DNA methylase subunit